MKLHTKFYISCVQVMQNFDTLLLRIFVLFAVCESAFVNRNINFTMPGLALDFFSPLKHIYTGSDFQKH